MVGKAVRLGGDTRRVVSVSMLTEGWDASTVAHVLGVCAFGTRLACEQVIGRALRWQSCDLNEEYLFDVEYADVLGIPSPLPASATSGALSCAIGLRARRIEFAHARTAMAGTGSDPEIVDTMAVSATKTRVTGTRRTKWREPSPRLAWSCRT